MDLLPCRNVELCGDGFSSQLSVGVGVGGRVSVLPGSLPNPPAYSL